MDKPSTAVVQGAASAFSKKAEQLRQEVERLRNLPIDETEEDELLQDDACDFADRAEEIAKALDELAADTGGSYSD